MTESDIERLADWLAALPNEDALSLEGVDGLFCALIASPELVKPSAYMPVIWGGKPQNSQVFADLEEASETISLLMEYWNAVVANYRNDGIHFPFIHEEGVDGIQAREWARGFMCGTRLTPLGWGELFSDASEALLLNIPVAAGEVDPTWPESPLTSEQTDELVKGLIAGAARAYKYFEDDRRILADNGISDHSEYIPDTYIRPEPKVGRNDPCPCGSGKKYKKCCGAPERGTVH